MQKAKDNKATRHVACSKLTSPADGSVLLKTREPLDLEK